MAADEQRVMLESNTRTLVDHERVGDVDGATTATVSVYLRGPDGPDEPSVAGMSSREEYATTLGAGATDISAVRRFAESHGLTVGDTDAARRRVELTGSLTAFADAFGTSFGSYRAPAGDVWRAPDRTLSVPAELDGVVIGVFGLDQRPIAHTQFRPNRQAAHPYSPPEIAAAYQFPTGVDGSGECVALIELGGGYRQSDLNTYFAGLGIAAPVVVTVGIDGGANTPGAADSPDGEVMLDIEVVGAVAPGARIAVYFAPNTDQGFLDAVSAAIHDTTHRPSVVSISWGSSESTWSTAAMTAMEQAFAAGAALGVTITVAAGDNGSSDGATDGLAHVDFPASAPHALACGGTRLILSGGIQSETVWNDGSGGGATGGGVSAIFPLPAYQSAAGVPVSINPGGRGGRGVPDVAGDADPDTGYTVRVDGETLPIGGTSAVAPLWAGLVALLNESIGSPVGFLQPALYQPSVAATMRDVISGSNGAYTAGPGWDACTGLGSPNGAALLTALRAVHG